jgi:hypothetical protein
MTAGNEVKAGRNGHANKRFGWAIFLLTASATGLVGAVATLIVAKGYEPFVKMVIPPKPAPAPLYRLTLSSPVFDDSSQRRLQFLLIENVGDAPMKDFYCKIGCARTVDISGETLVGFPGTSSMRRTADAIYIEAKSVPAGGSLLLVVWHKLGGIEQGDIGMVWEGKLIQPIVKYLQ